MNWQQAEELLLQGSRVKLPEWNGFWFYDEGKIKVFTRDNTVLTTPHIEKYNDRLDWQEMFISSPEEIAKCMTQFDSTYKKEVDKTETVISMYVQARVCGKTVSRRKEITTKMYRVFHNALIEQLEEELKEKLFRDALYMYKYPTLPIRAIKTTHK